MRVGFLGATEQAKIRSGNDNVVPLESMAEGAEVAATHGLGRPESVLYVYWKRQAISIECI